MGGQLIAPKSRTTLILDRYTQFKKYFSKMNNEDRLSKRGINLIFSFIIEGDKRNFINFNF